jgi:hypothetical protein
MSIAAHDPGGKTRLRLQDGVYGEARFSVCGKYRLWLSREWQEDKDGPPTKVALWIGMNPSTAEDTVDDPTIRREIAFTRRLGCECYMKFNVMDYRATDPKKLLAPSVEPRSPGNLDLILSYAKHSDFVIAAWGALPKRLRHYANETQLALQDAGIRLFCLGRTKDGSPRHPLYIAKTAEFEAFKQ